MTRVWEELSWNIYGSQLGRRDDKSGKDNEAGVTDGRSHLAGFPGVSNVRHSATSRTKTGRRIEDQALLVGIPP